MICDTFAERNRKPLQQKKLPKELKYNQTGVSVMSVDAAREDFWQIIVRSTIRERCEAIFNKELLSDVKFVVRDSQGGSESKTIPAHKFVLAISSPVFHAMFYGKLAETKNCVEMSDCDYESLLELFRFMYSDEANLSPDNVMQVLYLAKKYMLPSLADKCSAFLQENLNASNVFHVLPDAQKYEEKDLLDHCWKVIEKETEEAVKSDGFVTIERSVLEELVEKDSLTIKEVELFKAVNCWAGKECEKQGLVAEGSVKRSILGERIVKGIRFPVMELKEFADVVLDCDILTKKECFDMMKYFGSVLDIPAGFPTAKRVGCLKSIFRFRSLNNSWHYFDDSLNEIILQVDKKINMHAVRLFGSENNKYSVNVTVRPVNDSFGTASVTGDFRSKLIHNEIQDYPGFEVIFKPPINVTANVMYIFTATITGPYSWYGQSGLSRVEHSGVTFVFNNASESSTTAKRGQFAEFVFALT